MPRASRILALSAAALITVSLAACSSSTGTDAEGSDGAFTPITITHALGTTTIDKKPERVATVNWANQEVPLALGVVPVGMAAANFGDDDGDGVLPWSTRSSPSWERRRPCSSTRPTESTSRPWPTPRPT